MSMAAGARSGARVLQQLRSPTPFFSRAHQLLPPSLSTAPSSTASSLAPSSSRGFSADHGPARVNIWEAPTSPSRWKDEHFVFVSLAGWFSLFYGGYKAATGQSKPKPPAKVEPSPETVAKSAGKAQEKPKSDSALKKAQKKKEDPITKSAEKPAPKKKEEKPVPEKEDEIPPGRKGRRPAPKSEGDVPKRTGERPAPKKKEDKLPESNKPQPKDKKGGYKLVKVDDEK